ncbi:MAG: hypothetical protein PF636_03380 [Actinomycetota bacterium]|nr:hypothetical protein [Actinomycetota bacterium]
MVCLGTRCLYRFCDYADSELPAVGSACVWEKWYAAKAEEEFDRLFPTDGLGTYLDDRHELRHEWTIAHLLANRASLRMHLAFEEIEESIINRNGGVIDRKPFEHHALAIRYSTSARNRILAIYDRIPALVEKRRVERRLAKVKTMMLEHGYWSPYRGDKPPSIEDAPYWILEMVDQQ